MNKEIQYMQLLLSDVEKLRIAQTFQEYELIVKALQSIQQYINEAQTVESFKYIPDLLIETLNHIMNHQQYPDQILIHIEKYIKSILFYITKNIFDDKISQIFCKIMDPSCRIYKYNALSNNYHEDFIAYSYNKNPEYKQFIDNIKVGSLLDCIRNCLTTNRLNWNRGVVEERNEEYIKVRYLNESKISQIYNIKSGYLMPISTRSQHLNTMFNLQKNQVILATLNNKWILSTIIDRIVSQSVENIITYTIGFRTIQENASVFTGLDRYHDEHISACSPRLALCGNHIPRQYNSNEIFIDDSYDLLYECDYQKNKFYAILRPQYSQSLLLIKFINYFGSLGGFEQILKLQSVDILANYIQGLGNIHAQLYRSFCQEYITKLQGLRQTLLQSDDYTLRNMGREKINIILQAFKLLLDRIMSEEQRKEWILNIGLEFVLICFNCKFLDKKIIGLKLLTDLLKQAHNDQSPDQILLWIEKQSIFQNLFHHSTHLQLLERTKDLIKIYLSIENAFNYNYLSIIWNLMQSNDNELRSIIFKVFNDLAALMSDQQAIYFVKQIQKLRLDLILIEHVQLLFEMHKQRFHQKVLFSQTIEILWKVIEYAGLYQKTKLEDQSRTYLIELIKFLNVEDIKLQMIENLITNIKQQQVESSSLKILQQMICKFLPQKVMQSDNNIYQIQEEVNKNEFIKQLIYQQKIHSTLRDSIENLYNQNHGIKANDTNKINEYMNKLFERILTINTLIMIKGSAADMIDQQFLNMIWNKHILRPNFSQESEMVSQWFRDLIEKDENFCAMQLNDFFQQLLQSDSKLNENAFKCFKSILYYVNQKDNKIQRQTLIFKQLCDQYGNLQSIENTNIQEKEEQMDYKIMVDVNEIIGIKYLWNLVFNSQIDQAIQLLIKLNLSQQEQFMRQVIAKIKSNDEQTILKCLDILRELLNETERLDGLVKGNQYSINIIKDGDQNNNKVKVKVYQNMTILELRKLISKEIQINWEQIKLVRNGIVIFDTENGKTLRQLNIKKMDIIYISNRYINPIPKVPLVENNKLTPAFLKVLKDIFDQYSTNEKMAIEQLSQFVMKASNSQNIQQNQRIQQIFGQYSTNGLYLTLNNFIAFFEDSCRQQQNIGNVWWNLNTLGYKNDLSLINDDNYKLDEQKLPRYQLVQNLEFYNVMFKYLKNTDKVAQECWKLLCQLPVFKQARERVNNFESIVYDRSYQLIYSLKIIEYLLQDMNYCKQFIINLGFKSLQIILNNLEKQDSTIRKQGQLIILKIFIKHIAAQYHAQFNIIFQIQQSVKQPISVTLNMIGEFIDGILQLQNNEYLQKLQEKEEFLKLIKFTSDLDIQLDYKILFEYLINTHIDLEQDHKLIKLILILLTTMVGFNLGNCRNFFIEKINQIKQRYMQFLFAKGQLLIQKYSINSLYLIYRYQKIKLGKHLMSILQELFPSNENKDSQCYFDLLAKMIVEEKYSDQGLTQHIIQQLINYEPNESRLSLSPDKTLIGLLSILESLCIIDSSILSTQLIKYLYRVHLFCFDMSKFNLSPKKLLTMDYVKSKSSESRKVVYRIIILYLKKNFNLQEIDLQTVIYSTYLHEGFDVKMNPKSHHGYIGIRNLGCICYMNSMMQQFFMTPEFRYCMLRADDGINQRKVQFKDNQGFQLYFDDNHIHQFQRMLAYLDLSDRFDFNPFYFCFTYKDHNNQPIDVQFQQDPQEFLNHFFDSLDKELKMKGWQQVIEAIYGGQICSQMICNGCQSMRDKFDLFYTLSLKVKDVKSIKESFESMINGEIIKDYYCEDCRQYNDLIKRQCLSTLPNVLIIHLQRIVYNLDLFINEKLNSYLEFPHLLDLSKYTKEALSNQQFKNDSYYIYKLKGVVVHQGTALQGHYYSLINIQGEKWLKFNDSLIEEFDIKHLPYECFGEFQQIDCSTNAYILVYERIQKENVQLKFTNQLQKVEIMSKFENPLQKQENQDLIINMDYQTMAQQYISNELYAEIWLDNHKFMVERQIYTDEFFRFVKEIAEVYPYPSSYKLITNPNKLPLNFGIYNQSQQIQNPEQVALLLFNITYIAIELLFRSSNQESIKNYVLVIINLINIIPNRTSLIFQQLFINRQNRVFNVFLCAPNSQVREAIQQIMLHYLNVIIYNNNLMLNTQNYNKQNLDNDIDQYDQKIVNFLINFLQLLLNEAPKNFTKLNQYFNFWKLFVQSSQIQLFFANQIELISILADFYMGYQSPRNLENNQFYAFQNKEKMQIPTNNFVPQYCSLFQCIDYLLQNEYYQLSNNDKTCLHSNIFYQKIIKECQDLDTIQSIISKTVFNNQVLSRSIIEIVLEEINNSNQETIGQFLRLAQTLLNIYDNNQLERIQWLLGYPQPNYLKNYITGCSTNISQQCIIYLSHIGSENETISILNQLFANHKVYQNSAIQIMKMLLTVMNQNQNVFSYVIQLPPPSYLYSKYTDWFELFLQEFQEDCIKFPVMTDQIFFNKKLEFEQTIWLWEEFKKKFYQTTQCNVFDPYQPIYILGNTYQTELVSSDSYMDNVFLETYESIGFYVESKPTFISNQVFPTSVLTNDFYIQTSKIKNNSNIFNILQNEEEIKLDFSKSKPFYEKEKNINFNEIGYNEQQKINDDFINELQINSSNKQQINRERKMSQENIVYKNNENFQEQQKIQCNLPIQVAPLLKRFMINNQTNQTIYIVCQINSESDINFILPKILCKIVPPFTVKYLTTIMKTVPLIDWGIYNFSMNINFQNLQKKKLENNIQQQVKTDVERQTQINLEELNSTNEIQCQQCTYLQSSSNTSCKICDYKLQ
ncbi:unnamed protein product [Paramecium sonneborni]|uniref:USP domain-containing protein n=1 Tax=Paramecium sonneborni TaxID=65129 RepID=A0A8S1P0M2_9CILI|nr:unnamed protein product [Paramecium sonneborni]